MRHAEIMEAAVRVAAWSESELSAVLKLAEILRTCEVPPKRKYTRRERLPEVIAQPGGTDIVVVAPPRTRKPKAEPVDPNVTIKLPETD